MHQHEVCHSGYWFSHYMWHSDQGFWSQRFNSRFSEGWPDYFQLCQFHWLVWLCMMTRSIRLLTLAWLTLFWMFNLWKKQYVYFRRTNGFKHTLQLSGSLATPLVQFIQYIPSPSRNIFMDIHVSLVGFPFLHLLHSARCSICLGF